MKFVYIIAMMATGMPCAYGANPFCEDPNFVVRAPAREPEKDLSLLLTKEERKDPDSIRRLSTEESLYGHSELGLRFLARTFGYKGDFENPDAPEDWLEDKFAHDHEYRGMDELWDKWVRSSDFKLKARGNESPKDLYAFFEKRGDAIRFASCVATDVAKRRCENYEQKTILAGARVYFGSPSSREPCVIRFNGGTIAGDTPDKIEISESRKRKACLGVPSLSGGPMQDDAASCIEGSESSSWSWENPNKAKTGATAKADTAPKNDVPAR